MQEQDLPQQIAGVVREALREAGTPTTTRITKLVKNPKRDELFESADIHSGRRPRRATRLTLLQTAGI